ncbi:alpha/beta hydrolase [Sphingomonas mollis]
MTPSRRTLLTLFAAAGMVSATRGIAQPRAGGSGGADLLPLWPGKAPGAPATLPVRKVNERSKDPSFHDRWITSIAQPALVVRPAAKPNGAAVMLVPGGGYGFLSYDNEGEEQARWLNARGVTAFILLYRLPDEGWSDRSLVPLQDAQRGMRLIRAHAGRFGIEANRVAVLGFSAGGHLAGSLATRHAEPTYAPVDATDRLPARPDLAGLIYPVVSLSASFTHGGSRDNLLGAGADDAARKRASVELGVTETTPPIFLAHSSDDGTVPIQNSLALYQAMLAAGRPAELHAFDQGGHGFGVRLAADKPASIWPTLFAAYGARQGVFRA